MRLREIGIVCALLIAALSHAALATTFTLKANVSNAWTPDFGTQILAGGGPYPAAFTPSSSYQQQALGTAGDPITYQVVFYVTISDVTPGSRGFGNIVWNINLSSELSESADLPDWQPGISYTDINGAAPGGGTPLFFVNVDAGTPGDLRNIIQGNARINAATSATDLRLMIGEPGTGPADFNSGTPNVNALGWPDGNTFLGSLFVTWNGLTSTTLQAVPVAASNAMLPDGLLVEDEDGVLQSASVQFAPAAVVPEPTAVVLAAMGFAGLLLRRGFARRGK